MDEAAKNDAEPLSSAGISEDNGSIYHETIAEEVTTKSKEESVEVVEDFNKYQIFAPFLAKHRRIGLTIWGSIGSFMAYYSMYAFRKPFKAATWTSDEDWLDGVMDFKTVLALSQLIGYMLSKWVAVLYVPYAIRQGVALHLLILMVFAQLTLVLYGALPQDWKPLAMLLNGLPLGCVWGLVVTFVEGRKTSDIMLSGMSISFIISSGNVKDFALMVLNSGVCVVDDDAPLQNDSITCIDDYPCYDMGGYCKYDNGFVNKYWMPATIGSIFLPIFFICVFMLYQLPKPTNEEKIDKVERKAMTGSEMMNFTKKLAPAIVPLWVGVLLWTSYRDYRDTFQVEMFEEMGDDVVPGIFSTTETIVGVSCLIPVASMVLVKSNEIAVFLSHALILIGSIILGCVVFTYWAKEDIPGMVYITMTGVGSYMGYTPYNSVLYERIISYTGIPASVSFPMIVSDAVGYTGTFALFISSEFSGGGAEYVTIFNGFGLGVVVVTAACTIASAIFFYFNYFRAIRRSGSGEIENDAVRESIVEISNH